MNFSQSYSLSMVARHLNFKKLGRTKIYIILRETGYVDEFNKPSQNCIDRGYLNKGKWCYVKDRRVTYSTYAVNYRGVLFIRNAILNYLEDHDIPKVERKSKNCNSI